MRCGDSECTPSEFPCVYDPRWCDNSDVCPQEKEVWLSHNKTDYPTPEIADLARFAMLEAYGLGDLYYEQGFAVAGLQVVQIDRAESVSVRPDNS